MLLEYFNNMSFLAQALMIYLVIINIFSFLIYGLDKAAARRDERRTSENFLLLLSLIGGTIGSLFGIFYYRHKVRKISFLFLLTIIVAIQAAIIYLLTL